MASQTATSRLSESQEILATVAARKTLSGFFLSGMLLSFLGPLLPAWGHHINSEYVIAGNYFLSVDLGMLASNRVALWLMSRKGLGFALVTASSLACAALLFLAAVPPPASPWWRYLGLFSTGLAAGVLNSAVFHAISPAYRQDRASTVNLSGVLYGLGCLVTSLLLAGTYYLYSVPGIFTLLAMIPALFAARYLRVPNVRQPVYERRPWRQVLGDFKSPGAVLFALLLFFQFGNEWTIAGWLPVFLIQRLGISPEDSLWILSLYWLALLVGRVGAQAALPRVRHGRLLVASLAAALFGCLVLATTNNLFGAATAVLFTGGGLACVYPLVVERIAHRFPYYHPGFYNGIFSVAATGGLLAPATIGYYAESWGIRVVPLVPLLGTVMVFLLLVALWIENKLVEPSPAQP